MKPTVTGILFRRKKNFIEVLTQLRLVREPLYDPLYDQTWEAVNETLEVGESVLEGLLRGIKQECGKPDFTPLGIYGAELSSRPFAKVFEESLTEGRHTTGKGDSILIVEPFCFVQQMGPPQPWLGPVFLVEVSEDFEPDHSKSDGEAGEARWWNPWHLVQAIREDPGKFMGLSVAALAKAGKLFGEYNDTVLSDERRNGL